MNHLFCFGAGYCARAFMDRLPAADWRFSGSTRATPPDRPGFTHHVFNGEAPMADARAVLAEVTHVLVSAAPTQTGDPVLAWHRDELAKMPSLKWLGYLSTTGVYGNTDGSLVDETAVPQPSSDRSRRRLAAETTWLDLYRHAGLPVHVFRLPGIYGPGRSALDQVRAGTARRIDKPGHMFSRIHVDDIANALAASVARPDPGRIYNICDDEAASPADVTAFACHLLGVAAPEVIAFDRARESMSPMALSFWQDNRRVDNRRMKDELGVRLSYPTYREGLTAILEAGAER